MDGINIIERIHKRGAFIKVLDKPHLDLTTLLGRGFTAFLIIGIIHMGACSAEAPRSRQWGRRHGHPSRCGPKPDMTGHDGGGRARGSGIRSERRAASDRSLHLH